MPVPLADWFKFKRIAQEQPDAAERGRLMTAQLLASDPERRQRQEEMFGIDFCRAQYPEVYRGGFAKLLDRVRGAIPW